MAGVRRWPHHRRFPYLAGGLAGLLLAATLSLSWQHTYSQSAVTLLGSGRGLSAIVSTGEMRVLIVAGDDSIAFANAFSDAHPPTMRRIDVVVLTPSAAPYLAERAIELASPRRIMAIERREQHPEPDISDPVRTIGAPRTIRLGDDLLIDIDSGLITGQPVSGWTIRVEAESASVLLTELVPFRPSPDVGLVAVLGESVAETATSITVPIAHAADGERDGAAGHGHIAPGETVRIPIEQDSVNVPLGWFRPPES